MMQSPALRIRSLLPLLVVLLAAAALTSCSTQYADNGAGEYTDEYDEYYDEGEVYEDSPRADWGMFSDLDFYGQWFWVEPYGWTWRPTVVMEWRPFFHGHWIWTEYGWTWVSYEPFGWATYHYGWWAWEFGLGWIWIPDYEWYPARVDWLIFGDYVCWAPLPYPDHYWYDPWIDHDYEVWCVIDSRYFVNDDVGRYHKPPRFKSRYATLRHRAPERKTVERNVKGGIPPVSIRFETQHVGGRDFHRMVLPPEERERVAERETREKASFKQAYRDRYGMDPGDEVGSQRQWSREDNARPPEPREPKTKTKTQTRPNKQKPDTQVDKKESGGTKEKEKQRQEEPPKQKQKETKQEKGKEKPQKSNEKGGGKEKG